MTEWVMTLLIKNLQNFIGGLHGMDSQNTVAFILKYGILCYKIRYAPYIFLRRILINFIEQELPKY